MEYVKVIFSEDRQVLVDGEECGTTGETLEVDEGVHRIKLDGPQNYSPTFRRPNVTGTTFAAPMEVSFEEN